MTQQGAAPPLAGRRSAVAYLTLLLLGVVDAAGYSLIAPVLPVIAESTGTGPTLIGLLFGTFPLGMIGGFAAAGVAVRRLPPPWVILTGLALVAAGCAGFLAGTGYGGYAAARTVMGLGSGFLWLGITFATLACWPGQEYACMSRVFAAYSAGGLVGPALGSLPGVRGPFVAYLALVLLGAVLTVAARLPGRAGGFAADRSALRLPGFWAAAAGIVFASMALGALEGVLPLHFATRLGQTQIGLLYAATAVLVVGCTAAAARLRPRTALSAAAVLVVAGVAVIGASRAVPAWVAGLVLFGAGIGLANTGSIGVLLHSVPAARIVTAMVVWSQLGIAGYLVGPLLGGTVADAFGYAAAAVPLALAAVVVLATLRTGNRLPSG